ncbi:MAG: hypothetical protein KJ057_03855 [Phycisphaerae bacterium]|nr:MAG: hypothetical protein F9K17_05745 [Phycisphaerae bacterium]MBE7457786.1 hypothetical protein [Planctomycetia bacterium]MCK6463695.1 hypothetical protein [Phycisphaerae bacterium]MCL4717590.1 hypothetical protein [Phycisphaerae bacterium]NUQ08391.1 hypothetical protein [Phycisphaerae bacterium]
MMRRGILALWAAAASLAFAGAAQAGVGFFIDASTLQFTYTKGAGGPGSFGQIEIHDIVSSNLVVQHLNLGANGEVGGGDDTLLDLAEIGDSGQFSVSFVGDVFKHGANSYSIVGSVSIGDVNSPPDVIVGNFKSDSLTIGGGFFSFGGALGNPDGILQPSQGDSWVFTGLAADTNDIINGQFGGQDGVDGTVSIADGRGSYRSGNLLDFQFVGQFADLDAFFNANKQGSSGADMKLTVVPVPGAVLLASLGLAGAWIARRRVA